MNLIWWQNYLKHAKLFSFWVILGPFFLSFSDFITYNVDTHEISFIYDGSKKESDQGISIITAFLFYNYYSSRCWYLWVLFKYPSVSLFTVPAAGFTQRATIDPGLNEIHVLSVSRSLLSLQFFTSPSLLLRKSWERESMSLQGAWHLLVPNP